MNTDEKLALCYEVIMMTARSGLLNARGVRTGYTHWLGPELSNEIRTFSGKVSEAAINNGTHVGLVLEHFRRIQTALTELIGKHMAQGEDRDEFITAVKSLERVHIVTKDENNRLRRKGVSGDYDKAGIKMKQWEEIPASSRAFLRRKLVGNVCNSSDFDVS